MKKNRFAKRVSALTMAAALTASTPAWYAFSGSKKIAGRAYAAEEASESPKAAENTVAKSPYPAFIDVVAKPAEGGKIKISVDGFDALSEYFEFSLPVPEGEPAENYVMTADGFEVEGGAVDVIITAKSEETPYDLAGFTDGKRVVTVDAANLNAARYDLADDGGYFYYTSSDEVIVPEDYDAISLTGNAEYQLVINASGRLVPIEKSELAPDLFLARAAELKTPDIDETSSFTVERYTNNEDIPYYYGEVVKITPVGSTFYYTVPGSEEEQSSTAPVLFTIGEQEIVGFESFGVKVWNGDISSPRTAMDGFVVKDEGDAFVVELDPESSVAANKTYSIYKAGPDYVWDRKYEHTTNAPFRIEKASMTGDANFFVTLKDVGEPSLEADRECGNAAIVDNGKYLKVKPGEYYALDASSVYMIDKSGESEIETLELDRAKTDEAADGYFYYIIDYNKIHTPKTIRVDYNIVLKIDLLEMAEGNNIVKLPDGVAKVSIPYCYAPGVAEPFETGKRTSFDQKEIDGVIVSIEAEKSKANDWVVGSIKYNGRKNGDKNSDGRPCLSYDESKLTNLNEPVQATIFFDKSVYSHSLEIVMAHKEYKQTVSAEGNGVKGEPKITNLDANGSQKYGEHNVISAAPKTGYFISEITKNGKTIFKNGMVVREDKNVAVPSDLLTVNDDGSVLFKDPDGATSETEYTVIARQTKETDATRSFAPANESFKSLFKEKAEASYDYTVSSVVEDYIISYDFGEGDVLNLFAADEDEEVDYDFSAGAGGSISGKFELSGREADVNRIVYSVDKKTGIIYSNKIKFHIVRPNIKIDKDKFDESSVLSFLSFGIFGNESTTITVSAKDDTPVPLTISKLELWGLGGDEAKVVEGEDEISYTFDPENNPVSKGDVTLKVYTEEGFVDELVVKADGSDWDIIPKELSAGEGEQPVGNDVYFERKAPEISIKAYDASLFGEDGSLKEGADAVDVFSVSDRYSNGKEGGEAFSVFAGQNEAYWVNKAFVYEVSATDKAQTSGGKTVAPSGIRTIKTVIGSEERVENPAYVPLGVGSPADKTATVYAAASSEGDNIITANAVDLCGNPAAAVVKNVRIDAAAPRITSVKTYAVASEDASSVSLTEYDSAGSWTNKPVIVAITAKDLQSGVMKLGYTAPAGAQISDVSDVPAVKRALSALGKGEGERLFAFRVSPSFDGEIEFVAEDNVGNKSAASKKRVRTENTAPVVNSFAFTGGSKSSYSTGDENNVYSDGTISGYDAVQLDRYGYYFRSDTTVSVNITDPQIASGFRRLEYALVSSDSIANAGGAVSGSLIESSNVTTLPAGTKSFTVKAFWRGQVFVRAIDNAGNKSAWLTPDGMILESAAQHAAETHITAALPSTPYTADGGPLYASSISVPVTVTDRAGIAKVSWSLVSKNGETLTSGEYSVSGGTITKTAGDSNISWTINSSDRNAITSMSANIPIDQQRNGMTLTVDMTCNSGHTGSPLVRTISIDSAAPTFNNVQFSGVAVQKDGKKYYNTSRTAAVEVYDRNLDTTALAKALEVQISNQLGEGASYSLSNWTFDRATASDTDGPGRNKWTATLTLGADANYDSIRLSASDILGHSASENLESGFVIDKTKPVITGDFTNNSAKNGKYYNKGRKAVIKINEHNFVPSDAVVNVRAYGSDNITPATPVKIGADAWKRNDRNPDEWTTEVEFNDDGRYALSVGYTDPANNSGAGFSSGEFFIDKKAPSISQTFTKGGDAFATNGDFDPTVKFEDYNLPEETKISEFCKVEITKVRLDGKATKKNDVTSRTYTAASGKDPASFVTEHNVFAKAEENDGIYKVKIIAEDLAGNSSAPVELTVSINRYGSTYEVVNPDSIDAVKKFAKGIPVNTSTDVVIREINASEIVGDGVVTVVKNGSESNTLGENDYTVEMRNEGGEGGWYEYDYVIKQDNFAGDGNYLVNIVSSDEAGNSNSNNTPIDPSRKCAVEFAIDKTAPEVIIAGVNDGDVLKDSEVQLRITCNDRNLKKADALEDEDLVLVINGDETPVSELKKLGASITENEAGNIIIELPVKSGGSKSDEKITVVVKDLAGNASDKKKSSIEFTLSASFWDLHKGLVIGGGSVGALAIAALAFLAVKKRRES